MADILFDDLLSGSDIVFDELDAALTAQGAGVEVAATAPTGTAGVSVTATGDGVTDAATAPTGEAVIEVEAQGAGVTAAADAPTATASGFGIVVLADPINTGPGSIAFFSNFEGTAQAGDIVRFPTTNGFHVLSDGTCIADVNTGSFECFYDDGGGEVAFTVTLLPYVAAWGAGVEGAAQAPDASLYGGVNVSGSGVTDAATAPTGHATSGKIAVGAGATATAQAPDASVTAEADASGAGIEVTASAPDAVAETVALAQGEGVEATATAPEAEASGDVHGIGAGVTVESIAPTAFAQGDRLPGSIPYAALTTIYPIHLNIARVAA